MPDLENKLFLKQLENVVHMEVRERVKKMAIKHFYEKELPKLLDDIREFTLVNAIYENDEIDIKLKIKGK